MNEQMCVYWRIRKLFECVPGKTSSAGWPFLNFLNPA